MKLIFISTIFHMFIFIGSTTRICIVGNETEEDLNESVFRDSGDIVSVNSVCKLSENKSYNLICLRLFIIIRAYSNLMIEFYLFFLGR